MGHGSQESRAEGRSTVKCLGDWDITLRAMRVSVAGAGTFQQQQKLEWGALSVQRDL